MRLYRIINVIYYGTDNVVINNDVVLYMSSNHWKVVPHDDDYYNSFHFDDYTGYTKGKGKGMSMMSMMSKGKGKGMSMMSGKGKGMSMMSKGKGKGMSMMSGKGKGKGSSGMAMSGKKKKKKKGGE